MPKTCIYFDQSVRACINEDTAREFWEEFRKILKSDNKVYNCGNFFEIVKIIDDSKDKAPLLVINTSNIDKKVVLFYFEENVKTIPLNFDDLAHVLYAWHEFFDYKSTDEDSDEFDKIMYKLDIKSLRDDEMYHQIMYEYIKKTLREYYGS